MCVRRNCKNVSLKLSNSKQVIYNRVLSVLSIQKIKYHGLVLQCYTTACTDVTLQNQSISHSSFSVQICQNFLFRITEYEGDKWVIVCILKRGFNSNCRLIHSPGWTQIFTWKYSNFWHYMQALIELISTLWYWDYHSNWILECVCVCVFRMETPCRARLSRQSLILSNGRGEM